MVSIAVWLNYDVQIQALCATLLVVVALCVHSLACPYVTDAMDGLELMSLFGSFCTYFFGQFLFADGVGETGKTFVSFIIVLVNLAFMITVICMVAGTGLRAVAAFGKKFRKLCCFGKQNDEGDDGSEPQRVNQDSADDHHSETELMPRSKRQKSPREFDQAQWEQQQAMVQQQQMISILQQQQMALAQQQAQMQSGMYPQRVELQSQMSQSEVDLLQQQQMAVAQQQAQVHQVEMYSQQQQRVELPSVMSQMSQSDVQFVEQQQMAVAQQQAQMQQAQMQQQQQPVQHAIPIDSPTNAIPANVNGSPLHVVPPNAHPVHPAHMSGQSPVYVQQQMLAQQQQQQIMPQQEQQYVYAKQPQESAPGQAPQQSNENI